MSEVAKKLRDRRLNVWNQAMEVVDRAAEENRELSPEEQGTYEALNGEIDKLDQRIKGVLEQEKRSKDADAQFETLVGKPVERGQQQQTPASAELRAFMRGDAGAP
jgi:hypothetical protein